MVRLSLIRIVGAALTAFAVLSACAPKQDTTGFVISPTAAVPTPSAISPGAGSPVATTCGAVETIGPYDPATSDAAHIENTPRPPLSSYTSVPPASGPHASTTMHAGVYDQPVPFDLVLHSMEHGAAVIWYDPNADPAAIQTLATLVEADRDHFIMAPYSYPEEGEQGTLPEGSQMALVAWRRVQLCPDLEPAAVQSFIEHYRVPTANDGDYLGEAPEPGIPI